MPSLHLNLFGAPELLLGDGAPRPVHFETRKAIALLAYLAVSGRSHTRDALAALLWPEADALHARSTLRRTLSALTVAIGEGQVEADRQAIGLHPRATLVCDVTRFLAAIAHSRERDAAPAECRRHLEQAARLYRGDFMAGFSLRDSIDFDDWQLLQAEHLRREYASALDRLIALLIAAADFAAALPHARHWLALDPLHEPAHARLMQLYAWTGQPSAALHHYQDCVRILDQELGVPPLAATTALYEAIRDHRLPAPDARDLASPPASLAQPALLPSAHLLVGRETELAALHRAYASGATRFLVIIGETGIGKTRLAAAFLDAVQTQGGAVLKASAYEGETGLAYGPILAALRGGLSQEGAHARLAALAPHTLAEAARLLPELTPAAPRPDPHTSAAAQLRLFESLQDLLLALLAGPRPGIVFLDDAQWADDATLDLLAFIVRRLQTRPTEAPLLLAAWRGEDVGPDHRWSRLLAEGRRSGVAASIELARLGPTAAQKMVENAWGEQTDARLVARLLAESEGLPLVLAEYLTLLQPDDDLLAADWPLPANVHALVHAHLARIGETAWQTLTAAAVIGRKFDFETVSAASGRGEDETVAALEELTSKGLATELPPAAAHAGPSFDFRHEKLRSVVYDETSLARRRLLHRRVAAYLAERLRDPRKAGPVAGQIARHYQLGGEMDKAAVFFQLAGEHARGVYAHAEALAHFRAALAAGHPQPGPLHEAIGDLLTLAADYPAALRAFETASAHADAGQLAALEHKVGAVYHRQGDWHVAERHFQAALAAAGGEQATMLRANIYADWSMAAFRADARAGGAARAQDLAGQALSLAQAAGDARALAQAHNLLGILARSSGQIDSAADHLQQSLALARDLADPGAQAAALNNLAQLYAANSDLPQALDLTAQALALCTASGDRHRQAALLNHLADLLHAAGRNDEAMARLKQAVQIFAEIGAEAAEPQPEIWKLEEW